MLANSKSPPWTSRQSLYTAPEGVPQCRTPPFPKRPNVVSALPEAERAIFYNRSWQRGPARSQLAPEKLALWVRSTVKRALSIAVAETFEGGSEEGLPADGASSAAPQMERPEKDGVGLFMRLQRENRASDS